MEANMERLMFFRLELTLIFDRASLSIGFLTGLKKELMVLLVEGGLVVGEKEGGIALFTISNKKERKKKGREERQKKKLSKKFYVKSL